MKNDCLLIGAGISGLTAGRILHEKGLNVQLVDKGRGVGGRVATRWMGTRDDVRGRWDHGAQFATFRSQDLQARLKDWGAWEPLEDWIPSYSDPELIRKRPSTGMNSFAKAIAEPLQITRAQRITRLEHSDSGWKATSESGESFEAATCICTLPAPQLIDLLTASQVATDAVPELSAIRYERTLTLLAELDRPSGLPEPGYLRPDSGVLENVVDNQQKGISAEPTVTAHATPSFSLEWYDRDRDTAASVLRAALSELLSEARITKVQIHGWKFSKAVQRHPAPWLKLAEGLYAAGDGYLAGDHTAPNDLHPRLESAMLSGVAVTDEITSD